MTFTDPADVDWTKLRIVSEEVVRRRDVFRTKELPKILADLSTAQIERLSILLFGKQLDRGKLLENIEGKPIDLLLHLYEFSKGKVPLLIEYFSKPKFKVMAFQSSSEPLLLLLEAYCKSPKFLEEATYFIDYKRNEGIRYIAKSPLTKEQDRLIVDAAQSIKRLISKRYKNRNFVPKLNFEDGKSFYHVFYREKPTTVTETFHGGKKLTGKSPLFVVLSPDENLLEIKCNDPYVRNLVKKSIEKQLQTKLIEERSRTPLGDTNKKLRAFLIRKLEETPGKLIIESINFKESGPSPEAPLNIGRGGGKDVRHILSAFEREKLLRLDLHNINSLSIRFKDRQFNIAVVTNKDGTVCLDLKEDKPTPILDELKDKLKGEGILVGVDMEQKPDESERPNIFSRLLKHRTSQKLSSFEEEILKQMSDDDILKVQKTVVYRCSSDRHHHVPSAGRCPTCGSITDQINEYENVEPNYKGIRQFVKNVLISCFVQASIKERSKTRYKDFPFFEVKDKNNTFYVYVQEEKPAKAFYEFFNSSLMPAIIITTGKTPSTEADKNIFQILPLQELFFDRQRLVLNSAKELRSNYDKHLTEAAKDARIRLAACISDIGASDDEGFEDDVFVLLKYILGTGEQWGHKLSGRALPDGIAGFSVYSASTKKVSKFSLSWDCKYSKDPFDFSNQNSRRQAREYIHRTIQATEVKRFSRTLNAFVTVTNRDTEIGFKGFSDFLYKLTSWDGTSVLLMPSALIKLYDYVAQDTKELFKRRVSVSIALASYINEQKKQSVILDARSVDKLIETSEDHLKKQDLDFEAVSDHLVTNVIK